MRERNSVKNQKIIWKIKWEIFKNNIKGLFCIHHYLKTGGGYGPDGIHTSYCCKHCGKCINIEGNNGVIMTHK